MINHFTWSEFDASVEQIANKCRFKEFSGIYGVPRGGLCLAVALSHKLKIELISKPLKNSLIVDDVYETGITLTTFKNIEGAMFFVLFSKIKPTWWNTVHVTKKSQWIVFPWENTLISLKKQGINDLALLGGAKLINSFIKEDLITDIKITIIPQIIGGKYTWIPPEETHEIFNLKRLWKIKSINNLMNNEIHIHYKKI